MQTTTKTTVYLDGTEVREIIADHLRAEGVLPQGAKFTMTTQISNEQGSTPPLEIKDRKDLRVQVSWPVNTDNVVAKVG
jgi:hypothetical protein